MKYSFVLPTLILILSPFANAQTAQMQLPNTVDPKVLASCRQFLQMSPAQQAVVANKSHYTVEQEVSACHLLISESSGQADHSQCQISSGGLVVGTVAGDQIVDGGLVIASINGNQIVQGGLVVATINGGEIISNSGFEVGSVNGNDIVDTGNLIVGSTSGCTETQAAAGAYIFILKGNQ